MLSREDQKYVLSLVKQEHQYVLDRIGFDPTLKEVGHSFGEKYEEEMATAVNGTEEDGFQITVSPAIAAIKAFQAHTATGKLKAEITPTIPSGCHCSYIR